MRSESSEPRRNIAISASADPNRGEPKKDLFLEKKEADNGTFYELVFPNEPISLGLGRDLQHAQKAFCEAVRLVEEGKILTSIILEIRDKFLDQ